MKQTSLLNQSPQVGDVVSFYKICYSYSLMEHPFANADDGEICHGLVIGIAGKQHGYKLLEILVENEKLLIRENDIREVVIR